MLLLLQLNINIQNKSNYKPIFIEMRVKCQKTKDISTYCKLSNLSIFIFSFGCDIEQRPHQLVYIITLGGGHYRLGGSSCGWQILVCACVCLCWE